MKNKSYIWIVIIPVLFLISSGLYIWFFAGLNKYYEIAWSIPKLETDLKNEAYSNFYPNEKDSNIYAGTLSFVNKWGKGGILIWRNGLPKYFSSDKNTIYSYYDVCKVFTGREQAVFSVNDDARKVTLDIKEWTESIKAGNYVQITIKNDVDEYGYQIANEVLAYSFPLFLPLNLEQLCKK